MSSPRSGPRPGPPPPPNIPILTDKLQALPLEIIYEIIKQTDDRPTLRNWCLTSKALLFTAQAKLWSNVVLSLHNEFFHDFPTLSQLLKTDVPRDRRKCFWVKRLELADYKPIGLDLKIKQRKEELKENPPQWRTLVKYRKGYYKRKYERELAEKKQMEVAGAEMEVDEVAGNQVESGQSQNAAKPAAAGDKISKGKEVAADSEGVDPADVPFTYTAPSKWSTRVGTYRLIGMLKRLIPRLVNLEEIVLCKDISEVVWRSLMCVRTNRGTGGLKSIVIQSIDSSFPEGGYGYGHIRYKHTFTLYPTELRNFEISGLQTEHARNLGKMIAIGGSKDGEAPTGRKLRGKNPTAWRKLKHLRIECDRACAKNALFSGLNTDGYKQKGLPQGLETFGLYGNTTGGYYDNHRPTLDFAEERILTTFDRCSSTLTSLSLASSSGDRGFQRFYKVAFFPNLTSFTATATVGDHYRHTANLPTTTFYPFLRAHKGTLKALHIHRLTWEGPDAPQTTNTWAEATAPPNTKSKPFRDFYGFVGREMEVLEEFTYGCIDGNAMVPFETPLVAKNGGKFAALACGATSTLHGQLMTEEGPLGLFFEERMRAEKLRNMDAEDAPSANPTNPPKPFSKIERLRVNTMWSEPRAPPHPYSIERITHSDIASFIDMFSKEDSPRDGSHGSLPTGLKVLLLFPNHVETLFAENECKVPERKTWYYTHKADKCHREGSIEAKEFDYVYGMKRKTPISQKWEPIYELACQNPNLAQDGTMIKQRAGWLGIATVIARKLNYLKVLGIGDARFWVQRHENSGKVLRVWYLRNAVVDETVALQVKFDLTEEEWKFLGKGRGVTESRGDLCCEFMARSVFNVSLGNNNITTIW